MKTKLLFYISAIVSIVVFMAACSGNSGNNAEQDIGTQKMSGAEILEDAETYAQQQCLFKKREKALKNNDKVKDFDRKMKELGFEKKKAKNYYQKKYMDMPVERVAFQRAVKAARQQPDYCKN